MQFSLLQLFALLALASACARQSMEVNANTGPQKPAENARETRVQKRAVPPLLDDSPDCVCFAATPEELKLSLVGWVLPLPNRDTPRMEKDVNPFTGEQMLVLNYRNPGNPRAPSESAHPAVEGLPRMGTRLLNPLAFALLVNAIDGTDVKRVEGQLFGQELLTAKDEFGVVFRVPKHFTQSIGKVKAEEVATIASRWKPGLVHGPEYGDEASQPPLAEREQVLSVVIKLSVLAIQSGRDLFLWVAEI